MNDKFVVVKLGGSLLDLPDLALRLRRWLSGQEPARCAIVVGGGAAVEKIRQQDRRRPLGPARAHWLAIDAMSRNARRVALQMPELERITDFDALTKRPIDAPPVIFDTRTFLKTIEPHARGTRLPCSWDVTSDSIAARLGIVLGARQIVLLKSQLPSGRGSLHGWAATGFVDAFLPQLANELPPLRAIDFRGDGTSVGPD